MAAWKMEGLVVTPTTWLVRTSSARLPDAIRLRERSSSQMETPSPLRRSRAPTAVAVASVTVIIFFLAIGSTAGGGQGFPGGGGDVLGGETELGEQGLGVGGGAEVLEGDDASCVTREAVPRQADARLDRNAGLHRGRKDALAVLARLLLEPLHGRHRHHARAGALGLQPRAGVDGEMDLGTGGDQD